MTKSSEPNATSSSKQQTPCLEHIVVLMFENRSFDNLLGRLYPDGHLLPDGSSFNGVPKGAANPASNALSASNVPGVPSVAAHVYSASTDAIMSSPSPDPGEEFPHINTQLFRSVNPTSNAQKKCDKMSAPYNAPDPNAAPTMGGFVIDYINNFYATHGREPTREEYSVIMGGFSPDMLPVVSTLAREFAVYDAWFCAVPSQTFCNRSFFHASTSSGFVLNQGEAGYRKWMNPELNNAQTIFNRLHEKNIPWAVYFDESQLVSMTGFIHWPALKPFWKTNFRTMKHFWEDVKAGTLPAYSFIEPRLFFDNNDMHPPVASATFPAGGQKVAVGGFSDVRAGEKLLHEVYTAIRESASPTGSNAMNTMLLVTFDEHGGNYDHEPPPAATPPEGLVNTEMAFKFDRLGVRVPAIAISAYTKAGTVIHDQMHHAAVIATLCEKYGLAPLTARDKGACTILNAINLTEPRPVTDWPQTTPQYVPPNPNAHTPFSVEADNAPLSSPAEATLGILAEHLRLPAPKTVGEARKFLQEVGKGLFGSL